MDHNQETVEWNSQTIIIRCEEVFVENSPSSMQSFSSPVFTSNSKHENGIKAISFSLTSIPDVYLLPSTLTGTLFVAQILAQINNFFKEIILHSAMVAN